MSVAHDHPEVTRFLARLDAEAAALPAARREELTAEIRDHLREALTGAEGDEAAVRQAIDRLGDPADIVAAETDGQAPPGSGVFGGPTGTFAATPAWTPSTAPSGPPGVLAPAASRWGPLELAAVLLLTLGTFLLPVLGPVVGLVLTWVSDRWKRREKVVATVLTALPLVAVVLPLAFLFAFSTPTTTTTTPDQMPEPVVSFETVAPTPAP